jgi:hypothetical protein
MEKIWIGIKSTSMIAVLIAGFIIIAPMAKAVIGYFESKELLYNEQMVRLSESGDLASKRVEFNNKLLQAQIETLREEIKTQAKARNQEIVAFGEVIASLKQDFSEQIGNVYKDSQDSTKDYVETVIRKQMADGSEMPWSWAMYSPNISGDEKWTTGTYPAKLHTKIALGQDKKSGGRKDAYVESYMTSEIFEADKGKKFPVEIASIEWVEKPPEPYSFMFNPRLSLGFGFTDEAFGSLEMSFFSYGQTKGDMDWRFLSLGFGIGGDNRFLYIAPVEYNIGKPLPFMENLFVSPFIGLDDDSNTIWGGQFQIPF